MMELIESKKLPHGRKVEFHREHVGRGDYLYYWTMHSSGAVIGRSRGYQSKAAAKSNLWTLHRSLNIYVGKGPYE